MHYNAPPRIEDAPPAPPPQYVTHGYDEAIDVIRLQPFINIQARIREELALRDPPQPYLGEPTTKEAFEPIISTTSAGLRVVDLSQSQTYKKAEASRTAMASELRRVREERFRQQRAADTGFRRTAVAVAQAALPTEFPPPAEGLQFDPAAMDDHQYTLAELVGDSSVFHMRLIQARKASRVVIDDSSESVVAVIGGSPRGNTWAKSVVEATEACNEVASQVRLSDAEKAAGCTPSVSGGYGLVHEGEPVAPARGKSAVLDALAFASLISNVAVRRCAGYATCLFMVFGELLHNYFLEATELYEAHYGAERFMPYGIFTAATFHLGDRPRKVLENDIAGGWAAFLALGTYDWRKGGHLILWDFNLVVEFRLGETILFPRALVRHSFVPIAPTETQHTLIQFTPAPVFSIGKNFGCSDLSFAVNATQEEHLMREEWRQRTMGGDWDMNRFTSLAAVPEEYFCFHFTNPPNPQAAPM